MIAFRSLLALSAVALAQEVVANEPCQSHTDCAPLMEDDAKGWGNEAQYCDMGGKCFPACLCPAWEDGIDGACPDTEGCKEFDFCSTHEDCPEADNCAYDDCTQYCDKTNRCFPACECQRWEDSIDDVCPDVDSCELNYRVCEQHDECEMGEYCDDQHNCWGLCDCFWYKDAIDGACPADEAVETFCMRIAEELDMDIEGAGHGEHDETVEMDEGMEEELTGMMDGDLAHYAHMEEEEEEGEQEGEEERTEDGYTENYWREGDYGGDYTYDPEEYEAEGERNATATEEGATTTTTSADEMSEDNN